MTKEQVKENGLFTINIGAGLNCMYKIVDCKTIELYFTNAHIKEVLDKDKIVEIATGNFTLRIGDKFKHSLESIPSDYEIKYISKFEKKGYNHCYFLDTHLGNRTTDYILPCLGIPREELGFDKKLGYNPYLVNAYLTDKPNEIALLYRFSTHENYGILENNLSKSKQFVVISNKYPGFDLVIMKILPNFVKDVELFKKGSYSKLSEELKKRIVQFHGLKEKDKIWQIIYKGDMLMKKIQKEFGVTTGIIELDSIPNLVNEMIEV